MRGFIVGGISDEKVVREICKKLHLRSKIIVEKKNNLRKGKIQASLLHTQGCQKVILLKDSKEHEPLETRRRFKEAGFEQSAELCFAVREIESWLLADEQALVDYLKIEVKEIHNPEGVLDPAEFLGGLFKKVGKGYLKGGRDPEELAKRLHLEKAREKCPSFREFERAARN